MKRSKPLLIILLATGLVLGIKFYFFPGNKPSSGEKKSKNPAPAAPVTVFVTGHLPVEEKLYASGTLVSNEEVDLKSEASGSIVYLNLPEGKTVAKGTLLVKINDADIKAQFDKINIQLKLAEEQASRQHSLLTIQGISQQEYDIALSQLNTLKADSAFYRAQLNKTELRAPFDGVLGIKNVSTGSYITPALVISRIQQIRPIKIDFSIPEKYSGLFYAGESISFRPEGSTDEVQGKIAVRDPSVDEYNRSVRYRAITDNANGQLFPGAFVRVQLNLKDKPGIPFIPTEAVVPVLNGKKVYLVKNGTAHETMIETGLRTEAYVQVISGLKTGDSVVVSGNHQLKEGTTLKVIASK